MCSAQVSAVVPSTSNCAATNFEAKTNDQVNHSSLRTYASTKRLQAYAGDRFEH